MSVDEILTPQQFRAQWENFPKRFLTTWFDSVTDKLYYLKQSGGLILGQVSIPAFSGGDPPRTVAAINQFCAYRIRNPLASGIRVNVTRIVVTSLEARQFRIFTATSSVPTTTDRSIPIAFKGKSQDTPPSGLGVANVSADNNVASFAIGGFGLVHVEQLQALVPRDYVTNGWEILPGFAMDVTVGDTGDTAAEVSTFSIEWCEI